MPPAKKLHVALLKPTASVSKAAVPTKSSAHAEDRPPKAPPPRKAATALECTRLEQLPNIGPSLAEDLRAVGIQQPSDLAEQEPLALYTRLCAVRGKRQDPCVLDTFMAAIAFMRGAPPQHWWAFTAERKQRYGVV
jgi:Pathogenicity locus